MGKILQCIFGRKHLLQSSPINKSTSFEFSSVYWPQTNSQLVSKRLILKEIKLGKTRYIKIINLEKGY